MTKTPGQAAKAKLFCDECGDELTVKWVTGHSSDDIGIVSPCGGCLGEVEAEQWDDEKLDAP